MRKILKNKVYDTATAQYIGAYLGQWENETRWFREELYKKRTGEYFLYSEGGADSPHGKDGDVSEEITPLSFENAKLWGEKRLDPNVCDMEFGIDHDDDAMVRLHVQIPSSLNDYLETERSRSGVSKSEIVIEALENYLQVF